MRWDELRGSQRMQLESLARDASPVCLSAARSEAHDRLIKMADEVREHAQLEEEDTRSATEFSRDVCDAVVDLKATIDEEFSSDADDDADLDLVRRLIDELDARGWRLIPPGVVQHPRAPRVRRLAVTG